MMSSILVLLRLKYCACYSLRSGERVNVNVQKSFVDRGPNGSIPMFQFIAHLMLVYHFVPKITLVISTYLNLNLVLSVLPS